MAPQEAPKAGTPKARPKSAKGAGSKPGTAKPGTGAAASDELSKRIELLEKEKRQEEQTRNFLQLERVGGWKERRACWRQRQ